jgi:hypothetical protein
MLHAGNEEEPHSLASQFQHEIKRLRIMNFRNLLCVVLAFGIAGLARAKDFYVSQSGLGNGTGGDAADSLSLAWLNTAGNWGTGSGQISPGDTVHLVGMFTSPLVVAGNGTSQNPITILFEPGANFTSPCWPAFGAIQLYGISWIVIDGGVNGVIQNTANGTGLANASNSRGIGGGNNGTALLNYGVIQNLTITNIYRNIPGDANRLGYPVDLSGSFITVSNCNLSDGDAVISYAMSGANATNILLLNNRLLNFNHGIFIGVGDNSLVTNVVIAGNLLDHSDLWGNAAGHHLDDIIIANNTTNQSAQFSGFYIYQNTFGPHFGVPNTAAIFNGLSNPGYQMKNLFIYNNLFLASSNSWANGFAGSGSNVWVVNNTLFGTNASGVFLGGGAGIAGSPAYFYNNILMGGGGVSLSAFTGANISNSTLPTNDLSVVNTYLGSTWSDHNIIAGASSPNFGLSVASTVTDNTLWSSGLFGALKDWQTWYENEWGTGQLGNKPLVPGLYTYCQLHCDPHSTNIMPSFFAGTYIPATNDTVAVGRGTNLYWLGITNDFYGNPRTNSGNWTIGCFEPQSSASVLTVSLTSSDTMPTNGETVTLTWSSANATNVTISGFGSVALNGNTTVVATTNTASYTATATGPMGTSVAVASVSVRPLPPSQLRGTLVQ